MSPSGNDRGIIWKIDRFAIHDGPGIRSSLYFKGCPQSCLWCANPEGQTDDRELFFIKTRCNQCGLCVEACRQLALKIEGGVLIINHSQCNLCNRCEQVCPTGALAIYGTYYTVNQVLSLLERDRHIHRRSGGGVTCTGGEPLMQPKFLVSLLRECHRYGIHTVLETCGLSEEDVLLEVLPHTDWLFFDLKHMETKSHQKLTGSSNQSIIKNLFTTAAAFRNSRKTLIVRQVIVPTLNDGDNILNLAKLVKQLPYLSWVELLPYHNYGSFKYDAKGIKYSLEGLEPPNLSTMKEFKKIIESSGINCRLGRS